MNGGLLKTGDEISVDFTTGGRNAEFTINGVSGHSYRALTLTIAGPEPAVLKVEHYINSIPKQVGYFVAADDMAEFMLWRQKQCH